MAKSDEDLKKTTTILSGSYVIFIACITIIGLLSTGFITGLEDSDKLVPTLFSTYIPWALPILVLATFAAGMSTLDSQLLTASSIFVRDIAKPALGNRYNSKLGKLIGRMTASTLIIAIALLALIPSAQGPIIDLAAKGINIMSLLAIPMAGPLLWSRATARGAITGTLSGLLVQIIIETQILPITLPYGFSPAIPSLIIGGIAFVILSLIGQKPSKPHANA